MQHRKIVISVTGSSGSIYAKVLFDSLIAIRDQWDEVGVVFSKNAFVNWELELGGRPDFDGMPFRFYEQYDFNAPFASGSAKYGAMLVCPCSMGTLGRIATGISNDLTTRAADVILKERRRLVLLTRDAPLSLIHLRNMVAVTEAGGIICPACPSFYSQPQGAEQIALTVVERMLDLAGFEPPKAYRWSEMVND